MRKTDFGFYRIEFYLHGNSYDLTRDREASSIRPVYGVRFDILAKWFEKFSFKSLTDQRDNSTVMAEGNMLNRENEFRFLDSGQDFEKDYLNFKRK